MQLPDPVAHPVFLDMDGVLANFFEGVARLFGTASAALPRGEYDMGRCLGVPFAEIDRRVKGTPTFWSELPPYPWAKELLALFEFFPPGDSFILSHRSTCLPGPFPAGGRTCTGFAFTHDP